MAVRCHSFGVVEIMFSSWNTNIQRLGWQGAAEAVADLKVMLTMMKASKTRRWERVAELETDACVTLLSCTVALRMVARLHHLILLVRFYRSCHTIGTPWNEQDDSTKL